ncbi:MAG: alpha/beta hydrolase [Pseudomonadota bacterium]
MAGINSALEGGTRHLIDPELLPMLELSSPLPLDAETLPQFRAMMDAQAEMAHAALDLTGVVQETRNVPSVAGGPDIPVLVTRPMSGADSGAQKPAVLHVHGGGMVMGSPGMNAAANADMARALDCVVVGPDYRLAPETTFPGPLEDCYSALSWMVSPASGLDVDPTRVVALGDSAGGGLAAATALYARDRGGAALAGQLLVFPMLDHRTGGPDDPYGNPAVGEFIWTRGHNQFGWSALRGAYDLSDGRVGWFSPSLAADLSGLPPTTILTGSLDLFLDENFDYASRLVKAGAPVEFVSYPGAIHAFPVMADTGVATRFRADQLNALASMLTV